MHHNIDIRIFDILFVKGLHRHGTGFVNFALLCLPILSPGCNAGIGLLLYVRGKMLGKGPQDS